MRHIFFLLASSLYDLFAARRHIELYIISELYYTGLHQVFENFRAPYACTPYRLHICNWIEFDILLLTFRISAAKRWIRPLSYIPAANFCFMPICLLSGFDTAFHIYFTFYSVGVDDIYRPLSAILIESRAMIIRFIFSMRFSSSYISLESCRASTTNLPWRRYWCIYVRDATFYNNMGDTTLLFTWILGQFSASFRLPISIMMLLAVHITSLSASLIDYNII